MPDRMELTESDRVRATELYEQGLYVQTYRLMTAAGDLKSLTAPADRVLAARLATNLGGWRLGYALIATGWRANRSDPELTGCQARSLLMRRGPLEAWGFMSALGDLDGAPPRMHAEWAGLLGTVLAFLRDFDAADACIARALDEDPDNPWLHVERATVLGLEDRYEEALSAARDSLRRRAHFRPGVQAAADALVQLGRDEEAGAVLSAAAARLESSALMGQLALLQTELGRYEPARRSLNRFEQLAPLMDRDVGTWLRRFRAEVAYLCGDRPEAIALSEQAEDEPLRRLNRRMREAPDGARRVRLDVGFVRQHHNTCAPATLTAISLFWSMPADHLEVVDEICYDGTSAHSERKWAGDHGWVSREFTVSWESAKGLLDRGVPFVLSTVEVTSAHAQAVIGYDEVRRSLLIRDPSRRYLAEMALEEAGEHYRGSGPRGMAMVPADRAALLEGLDLPDADLYDRFDELQRVLERHDRDGAEAVLGRMHEAAPGHRLTLLGRFVLSGYDRDPFRLLDAVDALLELFPGDACWTFQKVHALGRLGRRREQLELLETVRADPKCHPAFHALEARLLAQDGRRFADAARLVHRALRLHPTDAASLHCLADIRWGQQRFRQALALYRFALCLEDKNETYSLAWFAASRVRGRRDEALDFLCRRFERFGGKSGYPGRTLYWALRQLDRMAEAFDVLDAALARRGDDPDLLLVAADAHSFHGRADRGRQLLDSARDRCQRAAWLRTAAAVERYDGRLQRARELWGQVLELEPAAVDAHAAVAELIAGAEGRARAVEHLERAVERFPHAYELHQVLIEWLRSQEEDRQEAALRRLLEANPIDAWARRELALALSRQGRADQARAEAALAAKLAPADPYSHSIRGAVELNAGCADRARELFRRALRLSVDVESAVHGLLATCTTFPQRRGELAFVRDELIRQILSGEGLLSYRRAAAEALEAGELLGTLRDALKARPDLWHAWAAVVQQLAEMDRLDEAEALARKAAGRFPLLPAIWLELARVRHAAGNWEGEVAALRRARQVRPDDGPVIRQLADAYERAGHLDKSRKLLERSVRRNPLDGENRAWLADLLWRVGEADEAIEQMRQALTVQPSLTWAWTNLRTWAAELHRGELVVEMARDLTRRRPGDPESWLVLARMLEDAATVEERLEAVQRSIELWEGNVDAHDLRAALLADAGRYDQAAAACTPRRWGDAPPLALRARRAWVLAVQGDLNDAIARMEAIVADEPKYLWGWSELSRWYEAAERHDDALRAARQMAAIAPGNLMTVTRLADALWRTGDTAGAEEWFRKGLQLAPGYPPAALGLFDLHLHNRKIIEARKLLERLRTHVGGPYVEARAVKLATIQGDLAEARQAMRALCRGGIGDADPLYEAARAMLDVQWGSQLDELVREVLDSGRCHPELTALWVKAFGQGWTHHELVRRVLAALDAGEPGPRAVEALMDQWCGLGRMEHVRRFARDHRDALRRDDRTWAMVGSALASEPSPDATIEWLGDYASRRQARPWMLLSLAVALRRAGRDAEAAGVSADAITRGIDSSVSCHLAWLAWDDAVAGDGGEAAAKLDRIVDRDLNELHRFVHHLTRAITVVARGNDRSLAGGAMAQAAKQLYGARAVFSGFRRTPPLRRMYRQAIRQIARRHRGLAGILWLGWTYLRS